MCSQCSHLLLTKCHSKLLITSVLGRKHWGDRPHFTDEGMEAHREHFAPDSNHLA